MVTRIEKANNMSIFDLYLIISSFGTKRDINCIIFSNEKIVFSDKLTCKNILQVIEQQQNKIFPIVNKRENFNQAM